jgi:tetratricopeptide (TPR) repeat protein
MAELWLERGEAGRALEAARQGGKEGERLWSERLALFAAALAEADLGHAGEVERLVGQLREKASRWPNRVEQRHLRRLLGRLASGRGDGATALAELRAAEALLPAGGIWWGRRPDHASVWYELARAELGAGDGEAARQRFERLVASRWERLDFPLPYVRSFYFLGEIEAARGDRAAATASFRRFLDHWGDGDLDRERVEQARRYVAGGPEAWGRPAAVVTRSPGGPP